MLPSVTYVVSSPAQLRREQFLMVYGIYETPFGYCVLGLTDGALRQLSFLDKPSDRAARALLKERFPLVRLVRDDAQAMKLGKAMFTKGFMPDVVLEGSALQLKVWQALLTIPVGTTVTYSELARQIGVPGAVRAVGTACGRNPIAYLVPCHRVLAQDGRLGGYRWGVARKEQMLRAEKAL